MLPAQNFYEAVYRLVRDIPRGRVMTYGQIATVLGAPRAARAVGYALKACRPEDRVPWQRVINSRGGISVGGAIDRPPVQEKLLRREGVKFDKEGFCDLKKYRWDPPDPDRYVYTPIGELPFL